MKVLHQPNIHLKFQGQELYAPTIRYPLVCILVQLEGYLGPVVQ